MEIEDRIEKGIHIITPIGNLVFEDIKQLKTHVEPLVANQSMIFDLEHVTHMDSSGLGYLTGVFRRLRVKGAKLLLVNLSDQIMTMLTIIHLVDLLYIYSDVEEALANLE